MTPRDADIVNRLGASLAFLRAPTMSNFVALAQASAPEPEPTEDDIDAALAARKIEEQP